MDANLAPNSVWDLLVAGLIGAVATGLFQIFLRIWEDRNFKKSNQIQAHSNLLGYQHAYLQHLRSYFLSNIAARSFLLYARLTAIKSIDFVPAKEHLENGKEEEANKYANRELASNFNDSIDLRESLRLREKSEDLELQVGNAAGDFWRTLGQVKTSFEDAKVKDFIKKVEDAEKVLGAFDKEITQIFKEMDEDIKVEMGSICLDVGRYAEDPNANRDSFYYRKYDELDHEKDSKISDAENKIRDLDNEITNLLIYLENLITPSVNKDASGYHDPMYEKIRDP